jgi:hypothetical protein
MSLKCLLEGDVTDFSWLEEACARVRELSMRYMLDWTAELSPPVDSVALEQVESQLRLKLPPSLHSFYKAHNGLIVANFKILSIEDAHDETTASAFDDRDGAGALDYFIIVDAEDGNTFRLDISTRGVNSEMPVVDGFHELKTSDWHSARVAESFGAWLRDLFDQIINREQLPCYPGWTRIELSNASPHAEAYFLQGAQAKAAGRVANARTFYLRAIPYCQTADCVEKAIREVQGLGSNDAGDQFVDRVLARGLELRRIALSRNEKFSFHLSGDYENRSLNRIEQHFQMTLPAILGGLAKTDGGCSYSFQHHGVTLHLNGGGSQIFTTPATLGFISTTVPKNSVFVGSLSGHAGWGSPAIYLLIDQNGIIYQGVFRGAGTGKICATRLATSLDEMLDTICSKYSEGLAPSLSGIY